MEVFADEFAENKGFDFRKTKWGMTQEEVIKAEGVSPFDSSELNLVFKTVLANKNALVEYFFSNGKLSHARFFINQGYYDPSRHHKDYVMIDALLEKKYGKSKEIKKEWSGTENIRKEFDDPMAIYFGYLSITSGWDLGATSISHTLKKAGTDGGIHHSILFSDKSQKPNKS